MEHNIQSKQVTTQTALECQILYLLYKKQKYNLVFLDNFLQFVSFRNFF